MLAVAGLMGAPAAAEEPSQNYQDQLESLKQRLEQQSQKIEQQDEKIEQQQKELQQLRARSSESWLNERRKEEVKTLVKEVLSDAETRASLQGEGMAAGHDGESFYIGSQGGDFLLRVGGQVQARYMYNQNRDGEVGGEDVADDLEGFDVRRAKLRFDGHIYDPALTYGVELNVNTFSRHHDDEDDPLDNRGGSVFVEEAWAAYEFADGWQAKAGQFKAPFLREEAVDSRYQLAVERSLVSDVFTVDHTQGAQLSYQADMWRVAAMLHDGSYQANTNLVSDTTDFAIAGRGEVLLTGSWQQFEDFTTRSGDSLGVLVGGGVDYENADDDNDDDEGVHFLKWTADASVEVPEMYGFNAYAGYIGQKLFDEGELTDDRIQHALVAQGGVYAVPDKLEFFTRWEYADFDDVFFSNNPNFFAFEAEQDAPVEQGEHVENLSEAEEQLHALTFGGNYYMHEHNAKATVDVVWLPEPLDEDVSHLGSGIVGEGNEGRDQFVIRGQFQLLF